MSAGKRTELSLEDQDMLGEILNIGAGGVASILGELMNNSDIKLSLPSINICNSTELNEKYKDIGDHTITSIAFNGVFSGSASLLFAGDSGEVFSKEVAGELVSADELLSMREGILKEIGNIVICGVLGHISKVIKADLDYGLPTYLADISAFASQHANCPDNNDFIITANINFGIETANTECLLFIILTEGTYNNFLDAVKKFFGFDS